MSQQSVAADEREQPATDADGTGGGHLRGLVTGLGGGVVATVVMSAFREPISKSPPPTAWFWAKFVAGGEPTDHPVAGLLLHVVYGVGGGAAFGALVGDRLGDSEVEREARATLFGLVFGLVLSGFGSTVILKRLLDLDLERHERFVFHVSHVVYGLTLGTWLGSRA